LTKWSEKSVHIFAIKNTESFFDTKNLLIINRL